MFFPPTNQIFLHIFCHPNPKHYLCSIKNPQNITIMSKESLIKLRDHILETLSYEERVWLVDELNQVDDEEDGICPYTKEELDARFDELESDFENGDYLPADETFRLIAQDLGFENRMERIAV